MIRVSEIKLTINDELDQLEGQIVKKLKIKPSDLEAYNIYKESIDARKNEIKFVYTVDCKVKNEKDLLKRAKQLKISKTPDMAYILEKKNKKTVDQEKPIVIGFGPSGMFSALILAEAGMKPVIYERGKSVDNRAIDIENLLENGSLDEDSNVQFGEGGAGTFSDGKLTTRIKDVRCRKVLEELVEAGAPNEIMYKQKPHIGTDILREVVKRIREKIIKLGGQIHFESKLEQVEIENNEIQSVTIKGKRIVAKSIILATGHSARDTYEMLYNRGVQMEQKPFSIGVRVEHPQEIIDVSQYGEYAGHEKLGAAEYKLVYHSENGRGVYSFCMCPGGSVICSASEKGKITTNGMSYHKRNGKNANSALLVSVTPEDYESDHPLAGITYQRKWEEKAYNMGGGNYEAPAQTIGDFLGIEKGSKPIETTYRPGVIWGSMSECLPAYVIESLKEAIPKFGNKIKGFDMASAILVGPETRSSSPLRIVRDEQLLSNIKGLYPIGEGAGYAGGIVSAAVDGIVCAEIVANK